jgi:hypothetical protein
MDAVVVLARLHREGLTLEAEPPDRLMVSPRSKITDELRTLIRAHKPGLLGLVLGNLSGLELDLLAAVVASDSVKASGAKVVPRGPRTDGRSVHAVPPSPPSRDVDPHRRPSGLLAVPVGTPPGRGPGRVAASLGVVRPPLPEPRLTAASTEGIVGPAGRAGRDVSRERTEASSPGRARTGRAARRCPAGARRPGGGGARRGSADNALPGRANRGAGGAMKATSMSPRVRPIGPRLPHRRPAQLLHDLEPPGAASPGIMLIGGLRPLGSRPEDARVSETLGVIQHHPARWPCMELVVTARRGGIPRAPRSSASDAMLSETSVRSRA